MTYDDLDQRLQAYLDLCERTMQRLERDGQWPWQSDSPKSDDLVESEDNENHV